MMPSGDRRFFMLLCDIKNVSKYINSEPLFENVSFQIHDGDRIGIVGKNGTGKSTLIKMILGEDADYLGEIAIHGYFSYIEQLAFEHSGTKSGGEYTKQKIYGAIRENADLLIADEPTCNLDMDSIVHLEKQLSRVRSCIIISHDEQLLNNVCNKILSFKDGQVTLYNANYEDYKEAIKKAEIEAANAYQNYLREKRQIEKSVQKANKKASNVKDAKHKGRMGNSEARLHKREAGERRAKIEAQKSSIKTRLKQLEKVDKPYEHKTVKISVPKGLDLHTVLAVNGTGIHKAFGNKVIFDDATFQLNVGEKLWLQGKNGSGKTTLIQMIADGDDQLSYAKNLKIGYFDQKLAELDYDKNIIENIMTSTSREEQDVRHILANLLFKGNDIYKPISVLSGGELVKVTFSKVLLSDINLLILDEPTNYLDMETRLTMEEALAMYEGTLLLVTHDRRFGQAVSSSVKTIKNGLIQ